MKTRLYISGILAFLAIGFFSSCEKDADVELPHAEPKLVVVCFITPQDTMLSVKVTRSQPVFQSYGINTSSAVSDATVKISGPVNTIQLQFDPVLECYTALTQSFAITAGVTYSLTVTTPQQESVSASTTVPSQGVSNFFVSITDSLDFDIYYQHLHTTIDYNYIDHAGENNYYRFFSAIITRDTITNDTSSFRFMSTLLNDVNNDGAPAHDALTGDWSNYDVQNSNQVIGYDCWLYNVNLDYYNFHQSLYAFDSEDPFSEPTLIYSNINGGLGVFAAANGTKIRIYR